MSKDLVFIASGGRTGTTFFGERLEEVIDNCWSEHEPDVLVRDPRVSWPRIRRFGLYHMVIGRLLGRSGLRAIGHKLMAGEISEETAIARLQDQRADYIASITEPLLVESSLRYWMVAPVLHKAFPGSRLIGVVRDPRDWVESWVRHQPDRHTPGFVQWFPLGPFTPKEIGDDEWVEEWPSLDRFGRLAWDWRCITQRLEEAAALSKDVRVFRFESLFGEDTSHVEELVDFAAFDGKYPVGDLSGFTGKVANASRGPRRDWPDWPDRDVMLIERLCGDQMRRYGYGLEPEWQERVAQAQSAASV
ncbi:hypothetical protein [Aurantiacibacter sp. MUD61]|uniref:hypothetical protein n=1 Tax=Aurantiacibacter sp. MUD61 TaxID=3009083 RepID=UPI0022F0AAF0|nr:hypothetical protein [Aurantiacibacter sp. MUD61]